MQILIMLFFLVIWLLILWIGSIALESTGLERSRARFQALSAISGTGFTTSHSEDIVEHPKRRQIISYLIFIGNAGILSFLVVMFLYVRAGLTMPSTASIIITVVVLVIIGLAVWLGIIDKITAAIMALGRGGKVKSGVEVSKILYQYGDSAIMKLEIGALVAKALTETNIAKFQQKGFTVVAIERGKMILKNPDSEIRLQVGDHLICFGNPKNITDLI